MPITLKEFQEFVSARLTEGILSKDPNEFGAKVKEIFDYAAANEKSMDEAANKYFDAVTNSVVGMYEGALGNQPDSPGKRKMIRAIAGIKRQHQQSKTLLERLGMSYPVPIPIVEAARPLFLDCHQSILDFLWDATRHPQNGAAQVATLGLLYWALDELIVAFYLAERKYTTQAYSHLRTVHDLLDKAELFFQQPQWADVWAGNDKGKILKELSPGAIRQKLGKPKFDPVYGFFSELGTHGTYEGLQKRMRQTGKKAGRTQLNIRVGGTPWDSEVDATVSFSIFTIVSVLLAVGKIYEARLHLEEVASTVRVRVESTTQFLQQYFIEPRHKGGIDTSGVTEHLENVGRGLEQLSKEIMRQRTQATSGAR